MGGMESNVKCPECGFISSSVLPQCEQCGYLFGLASHSETISAPSKTARPTANGLTYWDVPAPALSGAVEEVKPFDSQNAVATVAREAGCILGSESDAGGEPPSDPAPAAQLPNEDATVAEERCHNELTQRVQKFRRRRAHLRGSFDAGTSMEFDFQEGSGGEPDTLLNAALAQPGEEFDAVIRADETLQENAEVLDSLPLRGRKELLEFPGDAADIDAEADRLPVETRRRRRLDPAAMSIVMESSSTDELEPGPVSVSVAPLGRRFLAGVVDGLMLLFAMAGFVAIFWWVVGGRLHWRPVDQGVLAFVAGFLVLFYFALFGRLAPATVGQQAVGLVLRNLDGGAPTPRQAFWRAFGYLVSLSALMLGFVWALLDSEGLTWHDRISGTLLASRNESVPTQ
jgi:uncharacterized RDD family membrane protein YckC